jgi:pfkB family carbohydrate kinase
VRRSTLPEIFSCRLLPATGVSALSRAPVTRATGRTALPIANRFENSGLNLCGQAYRNLYSRGAMNHFDFAGYRIMVVGDLMLDKYLSGSVERLSPEAPVPVLLCEAERAVLGGAANVCANLAALGAEVLAIGVIGRDEAGSVLVDLLSACPKLNADHLIIDAMRPTTCKIRVMSGVHQIVRIDAESKA